MDTKLTQNGAVTAQTKVADGTHLSTASGPPQSPSPQSPSHIAGNITSPMVRRGSTSRENSDIARPRQQSDQASAWSKLLKALADAFRGAPPEQRQRIQDLIQNLEAIAEEQKKRHPSVELGEELFVSSLVALLGPDQARELVRKTKTAVGASINNAAGVSSDAIAAILSNAAPSPDSVAPFVMGADIVRSVRANPSGAARFLMSQSGTQLFRERLLNLRNPDDLHKTLKDLKEVLGDERFSALIAGCDRHFGRPLVADIISSLTPSWDQQRATLSRLCAKDSGIFNPIELARTASYLRTENALILETIRIESERAHSSVSTLEFRRSQFVAHLAQSLGDDSIVSLSTTEQLRIIQKRITEKFPGVRGSNLSQIHVELEKHASQSDLAGADQSRSDAAVISGQLSELIEIDSAILAAREQIESGAGHELQFFAGRFESLVSGVFPELSQEQRDSLRAVARVNLETLSDRMYRASGADLEALRRERDSIEWASVQRRVLYQLAAEPPNSARALELLNDFQLRPGADNLGRGVQFLEAAQRLAGTIGAAESYIGEIRALIQNELGERARAFRLSQGSEDELGHKLREAQRKKGSDGSDYWNDIYKQLGILRAHTELGLPVSKGAAEELEQQIASASFYNRTGSQSYQQLAIDFYAIEERLRIAQDTSEKARKQIGQFELLLHETTDKLRDQLLRGIAESPNGQSPSIVLAELQKILREHGLVLKQELASVTPVLAAPALPTPVLNNLAPHGELLSIGAAPYSLMDHRAVEPPTDRSSRELDAIALNMHDILKHDNTLRPSREELAILLECVGRDSLLGKQIVATSSKGAIQDAMTQLYARLSPDDALRVRLFLISQKFPELYRFFGFQSETLKSNAQPKELWDFISQLPSSAHSSDLSQLISVIPSLRTVRELEALVQNIPDDQLQAVLGRYQRFSGQSLGTVILELAPESGDARAAFISEYVARSRMVRSSDLAQLFPGGRVAENTEVRRQQLLQHIDQDRGRSVAVDQELVDLINNQARERAALQAALPAMTHLQKTAKISEIRQRLLVLEARFIEQRAVFLQRYDPAFIARTGLANVIEQHRRLATQAAINDITDPFGELAQRASTLVDMLSDPHVSADEAMVTLSRYNISHDEMYLFETFYLQMAQQRPNSGLTGDLERDISTRGSASELRPEQLQALLKGGADLHEFDLMRFRQALATENPLLAVQAMILMKARDGGAELLRITLEKEPDLRAKLKNLCQLPKGRELAAYYDAITNSDLVTQSVIEIRHGMVRLKGGILQLRDGLGEFPEEITEELVAVRDGVGSAALRTREFLAGEFVGDIRRQTAEFSKEQMAKLLAVYRQLYGTNLVGDLGIVVPSLKESWQGILSTLPHERAAAAFAAIRSSISSAGVDFSVVKHALDLAPTAEQRRKILAELNSYAQSIPNPLNYRGNQPRTIIDHVRASGSVMARADAAILERLLADNDTHTLSNFELERYRIERGRIEFQIRQLDQLRAVRLETHRQAQDFLVSIDGAYSIAAGDRDRREQKSRVGTLGFGVVNPFSLGISAYHSLSAEKASELADVHARMRSNQLELVRQQRAGLADISATRELIRLRGEAVLQSIVTGEDVGLRLEQNDRSLRELQGRDLKREWIVARRDVVNEWLVKADIAQKNLESFDWWSNVAYHSVKAVVLVGVSIVNPLAGFALACAWNLAEKSYHVVYNDMSLKDATLNFGVDLLIDFAMVGFSALRFGKFFAKPGVVAEQVVKPVSRWRFFLKNPFSSLPRGGPIPIEEVMPVIEGAQHFSPVRRLMEVANTYFRKGGGDVSRWVEVGMGRSVGLDTLFRALSPLRVADSPKSDDSDPNKGVKRGPDPSFANAPSAWAGSSLADSSGNRTTASHGSKKAHRPKKSVDGPPNKPPNRPPAPPTTSSDNQSGAPPANDGGSGGGSNGGLGLAPGAAGLGAATGGVNSYWAQTIKEDSQELVELIAHAQELIDSNRDQTVDLDPSNLELSKSQENDLLQQQLIALIDIHEELEDAIKRANADLAVVNLDGGELKQELLDSKSNAESQLTLLQSEIERIVAALAQSYASEPPARGPASNNIAEVPSVARVELVNPQPATVSEIPPELLNTIKMALAKIQGAFVRLQSDLQELRLYLGVILNVEQASQRSPSEIQTPQIADLLGNLKGNLDLLSTFTLRKFQEISQYFGGLYVDVVKAAEIQRLVLAKQSLKVAVNDTQDIINVVSRQLRNSPFENQLFAAKEARLQANPAAQTQTEDQTQQISKVVFQRVYIEQMQRQLQERFNRLNQALEDLFAQIQRVNMGVSESLIEQGQPLKSGVLTNQVFLAMPSAQLVGRMSSLSANASDQANDLLLSHARLISPSGETRKFILQPNLNVYTLSLPLDSKRAILAGEQLVTNQIIGANHRLSELATKEFIVDEAQAIQVQTKPAKTNEAESKLVALNGVTESPQIEIRPGVNQVLVELQKEELVIKHSLKKVEATVSEEQHKLELASREAQSVIEEKRTALAAIGVEARQLVDQITHNASQTMQVERKQLARIGNIARDAVNKELAHRAEETIQRILSEVVKTLPEATLDSLGSDFKNELQRVSQLAAIELRAAMDAQQVRYIKSESDTNPQLKDMQLKVPMVATSDEISAGRREQRTSWHELIERGIQVSERLCGELAEVLSRDRSERQLQQSVSTKALEELSSYAARSSELIRQASEGLLTGARNEPGRSAKFVDSPAANSLINSSTSSYVDNNANSNSARVATSWPAGSVGLDDRARSRRKRAKRSVRDAARRAEERSFIMQQLLSQDFERSKRDKLLRLLIKLAISESEYRNLVAKLGELDLQRSVTDESDLNRPFGAGRQSYKVVGKESISPELLVQRQEKHIRRQHEYALQSIPTMKSDPPRIQSTTVAADQEHTRAELYLRLRRLRNS